MLQLFPKAGRIVPEFDDESTREVIVADFRVIYELSDDHVTILNVIHGRQRL